MPPTTCLPNERTPSAVEEMTLLLTASVEVTPKIGPLGVLPGISDSVLPIAGLGANVDLILPRHHDVSPMTGTRLTRSYETPE